MQKVLTIAGSDCSGGAGIQADIKTIIAHKLYAMSVITALTAQNTTGVYGIFDASPEFVAQQMDCVFTDIYPDAIKIGMTSRADTIRVIADRLRHYGARNIVLDPVMVSTSGSRLLNEDAVCALTTELAPCARLLTPNIPESEALCGFAISCKDDMLRAAEHIARNVNTAVLIKGGHLDDCADDLLFSRDIGAEWFASPRIDNKNTHGTGCTLSSAIACGLAEGLTISESVKNAKDYIVGAISAMLDIGAGAGPLDHCWNLHVGHA